MSKLFHPKRSCLVAVPSLFFLRQFPAHGHQTAFCTAHVPQLLSARNVEQSTERHDLLPDEQKVGATFYYFLPSPALNW